MTIKDVAKVAGVSTTTISRVLNNDPHVKPKTKEHVQEVIDRIGYVPSYAARSLVRQSSRVIGLIIPELENPYYNKIVMGVEKATSERGYGMILVSLPLDGRTNDKSTQMLAELGVCGIIHAGPLKSDQIIPQLARQDMHYVLIGRKIDGVDANCVLADDFEAMKRQTNYLISLGHKKIGFIKGKKYSYTSQLRLDGYLSALQDAGITLKQSFVAEGALDFQSGYQAAGRLLKDAKGITAMIACDDLMALGARERILEEGKRIPEDISLVGFDNIFWAGIKGVDLTTVQIPCFDMGYEAGIMLIKQIENPDSAVKQVELKTKQIIRGSAGPCA